MECQIPDLSVRKAMGFGYSAFSYISEYCPVTPKDESELLSIVLLVANAVGPGLKLSMLFFYKRPLYTWERAKACQSVPSFPIKS